MMAKIYRAGFISQSPARYARLLFKYYRPIGVLLSVQAQEPASDSHAGVAWICNGGIVVRAVLPCCTDSTRRIIVLPEDFSGCTHSVMAEIISQDNLLTAAVGDG